jgi:pyridoxal phosphate enzyme (YggS family)
MPSIAENLSNIQQQISSAAEEVDRNPEEVSLVAVSKTRSLEQIREAIDAGQLDFGENRPQELRDKHPELPDSIRWHMIGTLQRNKVKYIAPFIHLIHSVDSEKLLREINKEAAKNDRTIDCLLQLNISEEDAKHGLNEARAGEVLNHIDHYPHVRICGLMGMAAFTDDEELIKRQFARLRKAKESLSQAHQHDRIQLKELSMGMSGDFPIAIAEGATMVRVGSAIFK